MWIGANQGRGNGVDEILDVLLYFQEPILYIIRMQRRYSPNQVEPLANYHIIGGQVNRPS